MWLFLAVLSIESSKGNFQFSNQNALDVKLLKWKLKKGFLKRQAEKQNSPCFCFVSEESYQIKISNQILNIEYYEATEVSLFFFIWGPSDNYLQSKHFFCCSLRSSWKTKPNVQIHLLPAETTLTPKLCSHSNLTGFFVKKFCFYTKKLCLSLITLTAIQVFSN